MFRETVQERGRHCVFIINTFKNRRERIFALLHLSICLCVFVPCLNTSMFVYLKGEQTMGANLTKLQGKKTKRFNHFR